MNADETVLYHLAEQIRRRWLGLLSTALATIAE